jgi:hypothetical protein
MATTSAPVVRAALGGAAAADFTWQWPWVIAEKGGQYFEQISDVASSLMSGGQAVSASSAGAVAAVASGPTNPANTDQVLNNGLFASALNSVQADQLLRTVFIGWAGGAQVGIFGGGGGGGVAYDEINHSNRSGVTYGMFKVGIGAQISTGLLLGAMTNTPGALNDDTAVWEFGATLAGIGGFFAVIMSQSSLDLIGFTVNIGVGGGYSSATGYGSISTT